MIARYECEQCFNEYDDDGFFVQCHGDVCGQMVCKNCAEKCKNTECKNYVCKSCLESSSSRIYCGNYCINCAVWETKKNGDWKNFDYISKKITRKQALKLLSERNKNRA